MAQYKILHILGSNKKLNKEAFLHYNAALKSFCLVTSLVTKKLQKNDESFITLKDKYGLLSSTLHCRSLIQKIQPDLIIVHDDLGLSFAKIASFGCQTRILGVRHNCFKSKFASWGWQFQSDFTIATNKTILDLVKQKAYLVYNSIKSLGIEGSFCSINPHRPIRIGFLGELSWHKGVQFLIKAIGLLNSKSLHNYELIIGGEGKYKKALKNLSFLYGLEGNIKFINYIENRKKFFQDLDIFCLPSLEENFPFILVETMAHGIPIVASDIVGIKEIITNEKNGLLFKAADHHSLADKIAEIINNNDKRLSLIEVGLQEVQGKYSITRLTQDLHQVIHETIGH